MVSKIKAKSRIQYDVVEVFVVPLLCSGMARGDSLKCSSTADGTAPDTGLDGHRPTCACLLEGLPGCLHAANITARLAEDEL